MIPLNEKLLQRFLKLASDRLQGDWVILGGALLPLMGRSHRATTDIDFVPVAEASANQSLKIMKICEELGLPLETVNGAAQFFLHKIDDFEANLVLLRKGKKAKIYRPSVMLYIQLKLKRLSESDLSDCLEMLMLKKGELAASERKALVRQIQKMRVSTRRPVDQGREKRLSKLQEFVKNLE